MVDTATPRLIATGETTHTRTRLDKEKQQTTPTSIVVLLPCYTALTNHVALLHRHARNKKMKQSVRGINNQNGCTSQPLWPPINKRNFGLWLPASWSRKKFVQLSFFVHRMFPHSLQQGFYYLIYTPVKMVISFLVIYTFHLYNCILDIGISDRNMRFYN